jgi:hypothetical protein
MTDVSVCVSMTDVSVCDSMTDEVVCFYEDISLKSGRELKSETCFRFILNSSKAGKSREL